MNIKMVLPDEWKAQNVELVTQLETVNLEPGKHKTIHVFIKFPQNLTGSLGMKKINLEFVELSGEKNVFQEEVKLVGPKSI